MRSQMLSISSSSWVLSIMSYSCSSLSFSALAVRIAIPSAIAVTSLSRHCIICTFIISHNHFVIKHKIWFRRKQEQNQCKTSRSITIKNRTDRHTGKKNAFLSLTKRSKTVVNLSPWHSSLFLFDFFATLIRAIEIASSKTGSHMPPAADPPPSSTTINVALG